MHCSRARQQLLGLLIAGSACLAASASAQTLFSTDFEADTVGSVPTGWNYVDFSGDNNPGPVVSSNPLTTGIDTSSQVLYVAGPGGDTALFTNSLNLTPYIGNDGVTGDTITLSFDYLASDPTSSGLLIGLASFHADPTSLGGYTAVGGDYYIVAPNDNGQIGTDEAILPTGTGWQHVSVTLSGPILANFAGSAASLSNVSVYLEQWTQNDGGGDVYLDNLQVTAVPEMPVTGIAVGLASLAIAGIAIRRRAILA